MLASRTHLVMMSIRRGISGRFDALPTQYPNLAVGVDRCSVFIYI